MRDYAETIKNLRETAKGLLFDAMPYRASVMKDAADAIEELLDELTTIRKQLPHWISVEDELPEVGVDVLVTDGSNVCISRQVRYVSPTERFTFWSRDDLDLTHWMPLPTPPKEDA